MNQQLKKKLEEMAFESALGDVLSQLPKDREAFMRWYTDTSGESFLRHDIPELDDMLAWEPLEDETDDHLRDLISAANDATLSMLETAAKMAQSAALDEACKGSMNGGLKSNLSRLAVSLEEGCSADIFYDAGAYGDAPAVERIKATRQAMQDAAAIIKGLSGANLNSLLEIARQVLECPSLTKVVAESMDVSNEEMSRLRDGLNSFMEEEAEATAPAVIPLTPMQKAVLQHYEGGEFSYLQSVKDAEKVGDTLLLFALREVGDVADDRNDDDARHYCWKALNKASGQLFDVAHALGGN